MPGLKPRHTCFWAQKSTVGLPEKQFLHFAQDGNAICAMVVLLRANSYVRIRFLARKKTLAGRSARRRMK